MKDERGIMAQRLRFGLTLSNRGVLLGLTTPEGLLQMAEMADAAGVFEHVWVGDQIMPKPRMESITLMAAMAARTKRVKIAVACMASFPSRHPVVLINEDRDAAIQESTRFLEEYYTPIKFPRDRVEGWVACGTPTQCVQQLQTFIDAGATDILLRSPAWDQRRQFKRYIEEVLPNFA